MRSLEITSHPSQYSKQLFYNNIYTEQNLARLMQNY